MLSQDSEGDDGDPVYIVDRLVARYAKLSGGLRTVFYFVKWQQYGRSYDSWEPRDNLLQLDALRQFERQHGQIDPNDDGLLRIHDYGPHTFEGGVPPEYLTPTEMASRPVALIPHSP